MSSPKTDFPKNPAGAPFDTREDKLLRELKITRDELRARRAHLLTEGVHWAMVNRHATLTSAGAQKLRDSIKTPLPPEQDPTRPTGSAKGQLLLGPVLFKGRLKAWRAPGHNTRLLIAYIPGTEPANPLNLVSVAVRDNRNFLPHMELTARLVEGQRYELVGACPRWRGRW